MKYITIITILFLSLSGFSQSLNTEVNTYAVVVGISDYQDEAIPDLRFADKDAEAFAGFLQSPAGGALDEDHLKVLINEQATVAQFAMQLDWLWEVVKEGDRVIIYFSGHGDVERKSITQPGYLLCWDAPSQVYLAGGAMNVRDLNDVVSTLSIQNKAKVILVTDACRAGKLSGSSIGGAQATAANLAKQYANEIKILSCQPDEYSIEGEQWGGGRGAFSYHLLDGLYGLADDDEDMNVNLKEIGRYLEDRVSEEVAPQSQNPMTVGSKTEKLTDVFPEILEQLKEGRKGQMQMFTATESRSIEDDVLAAADTNIVELYLAFKDALKEKNFLCSENTSAPEAKRPTSAKASANNCADFYYLTLSQEPQLERLHSSMRRNYAAALQDDAQQTLNSWLKIDHETSMDATQSNKMLSKVFTEKVRTYPACLARAAELLGKDHYLYATLMARKYFFEGYLLVNTNYNPNVELGKQALTLFRQSLKWQPEQPQVYWQMSTVFGYQIPQLDSLEHYAWIANNLYPRWTKPLTLTAFCLSFVHKQQDRARPFLERASSIDSTDADVMHSWAVFNFREQNYSEAEQQLKKAIDLDSTNVNFWNNLGYLYNLTERYEEAERVAKKAIELDSTYAYPWNILSSTYFNTKRYDEAEATLKKAVDLDSTFVIAWTNLGALYRDTKRYNEMELVLNKAIRLDSSYAIAWSTLGELYLLTQRYEQALPLLQKAVDLDSTNQFQLHVLGYAYYKTKRFTEAESIFWHLVTMDSTFLPGWNNIGNIYQATNRFDKSEEIYRKALELDENFMQTYLNYAKLKTITGDLETAFSLLEQAIQKGYNNFQGLQTYQSFAPLREQTEQWDTLMKKYFSHIIYYNLACEQSLLGQLDQAFESLEQSLKNGWQNYGWMNKDTDLVPLRKQEKRWNALMQKYFPEQIKEPVRPDKGG